MTKKQIKLNQATEAAGEGKSLPNLTGAPGLNYPLHGQEHSRYYIRPLCLKFLLYSGFKIFDREIASSSFAKWAEPKLVPGKLTDPTPAVLNTSHEGHGHSQRPHRVPDTAQTWEAATLGHGAQQG